LSRYPTDEEKRTLSAALDASPRLAPENARSGQAARPAGADPSARRRALEDLAWAILTGREFLFTH
jgi:hypothetical protein